MLSIAAVVQQVRCTSWRHARRRPWRHILSGASIAVAVALFVSMRITQTSLLATFRSNMDALAGRAEYVVSAPHPLTLDLLAALDKVPGVRAAPIVQASAVIVDQRQTVTVMGIDAARDAKLRNYAIADAATVDLPSLLLNRDTVVITQALAQRYEWKLGTHIHIAGVGPPREYVIAGVLKHDGPAAALGGNIIFLPLAAAQRLADRGAVIDRVEMAINRPATPDSVAAALGPAYTLSSAKRNNPTFDALFSQFQVILVCISALSGLIGVFIVYNSMSLSIVERAKEIGTIRALGAQRGEVLLTILIEAAALGLLASIAGLALGLLLAQVALEMAGGSLSLIIDLGPPVLSIPTDIFWLAPFVGMFAAAVGALAPARAAAAQPPVLAMKPGAVEERLHARTHWWFAAGIVLMVVGLALVNNDHTVWRLKVSGVLSAFIAVGLMGPQVVKWIAYPVRRTALATLRLPGILALDSIVKFPTRTSLSLIALGGSLSIVVSMAGLVQALNGSISDWLDQVMPYDLSINGREQTGSPYETAGNYPSELLDELAADPAVEITYGVRMHMVAFDNEQIMILAADVRKFDEVRTRAGLREQWLPPDRLEAGEVVVSDNLAVIRGMKVGDQIELPTARGSQSFRIAGIRPDYTWFRGCVLMDRAVYANAWDDPLLSFVDMRLRPGVDVEKYRTELTQRLTPRFPVFIYRGAETKRFATKVTGEWFRLANVQLVLAVLIGGVGVANCLLISLLSQARQIGLLRAIGAAPAHVRQMLRAEAIFLGLAGGVLGCILGIATIRFIVNPLAIRASGFVLPLTIPYETILAAIVAGLVISLLSALLPLRAARRIDVIQAIGYE